MLLLLLLLLLLHSNLRTQLTTTNRQAIRGGRQAIRGGCGGGRRANDATDSWIAERPRCDKKIALLPATVRSPLTVLCKSL